MNIYQIIHIWCIWTKIKNELLNELKDQLIQKKNNEITQEIVKYELDELNKDLDDYIKILEIKINAINEQSQINAIN
jgi:hypothetical protein